MKWCLAQTTAKHYKPAIISQIISVLLVQAQTHAVVEPGNDISVVEKCVITVPDEQIYQFHLVNDKTGERNHTDTEGGNESHTVYRREDQRLF